jgi:hypothetical protein
MLAIKRPPEKGVDTRRLMYIYRETYHQFHRPSVTWERMIIGGGLDSENTEGSDKYVRSVLSCPSLRLKETDKAVRRPPKNEPPKTLTRVTFNVSMKERESGSGK